MADRFIEQSKEIANNFIQNIVFIDDKAYKNDMTNNAFSALDVSNVFGLSGNFWLLSFKISYLCLPLFHETRTTPSCHPSGCAYRQL